MGNNICGLDEEKKHVLQPESKIITTRTIKQTTISIIQADIAEDLSDVVVNASHEPAWSYLAKRNKNNSANELTQQMKIGELIKTKSDNVNSLEIYHVRLPYYQDTRDLQLIFQSYQVCLRQKGFNSISFTEQNSPNFSIPKQFHAEVLIRAILQSITDDEIAFEQIKFVSLDQITLKYFAYELMKLLDEFRIPDLYKFRQQQFLNYLQNTEELKNEVYLLSTGITTDIDQFDGQQ
ncbi:unnamed protein product [Paramecium pentaurelia]|uniref:Macro domain-containing protein n=1 Tax=Paramecium pentaurelia TaxID=43138 RepID=A0A8S1XT96_9CILI|nr:unnamed protein product [Paramecium pentaurelia]